MSKIIALCAMLFVCCLTSLLAQVPTQPAAPLPKVFVMGEYEQAYETLTNLYPRTLLEICNSDMRQAFEKWLEVAKALEAHAENVKFDIRGVKVRMHIFWEKDGSITHIGYIMRPESRNISKEHLSAFLSSFTRVYRLPINAEQPFSHYTIASFPIFSEPSDH
ncbi:MAG TPA: hypothetical protein PKD70_01520 [Saprospiraceae bacterium]|nr:hypothetical protein [Saprospiraceae bacterium]HMP12527.1 hypothetical protein [Saprospiraceae bacterium]